MTLPKWRDVLAVAGMIAGMGGTATLALGDSIDVVMPGLGKKITAVLSIAAFGAGLILRTNTSNLNTADAATTTEGLKHG